VKVVVSKLTTIQYTNPLSQSRLYKVHIITVFLTQMNLPTLLIIVVDIIKYRELLIQYL